MKGGMANPALTRCRKKRFEWWGPTFEEARKVALSKSKGLKDKRMSLKESVKKFVRDGANIGIGGFVNTRIPVAAIHEIIRYGVKNLTLSFHSQAYAVDILCGAMIIDENNLSIERVELAYEAHEMLGLAPCFRYLVEKGLIELDDYTNYGMTARFKAAAMGVPFMPVMEEGGTSMETVNRGRMIECPFTGENVYLLPACHPTVGLIHVQMADIYGNCRIFGTLCTCPEIAQASLHTIVTTEVIIPNENVRRYPNLTEIPWFIVDAVVEQPWGGYPGAVYGFYWYDVEHLRLWIKAGRDFRKTGKTDALENYFNRYVFECETFDDFISKVPYKTLKKLKALDGNRPIIWD